MARPTNPFEWPLSLKVPLLVGVLMVSLGVAVSNVVLVQLSNTQESNLRQLSEAYLDGVSSAVLPHVLRRDVWEVFDVLDRAHSQYEGLNVKNTIIVMNNENVLAASDPTRFPVDSVFPKTIKDLFGVNQRPAIDELVGNAWVVQGLLEGGQFVGKIYAELDINRQLMIRRNTLLTLITFNTVMTVLMAGLGYALVRRMLKPLSILGDHVNRIADGNITEIEASKMPRRKGEFHALMTQFNTMAQSLRERETLAQRLAEEEKLAILGKLASGMAHEVNNPLGGMGNAIDTIRKHGADGQIRTRSLDILERGLDGIAKVTQATLATYKGGDKSGYLTRRDLEDVEFLIHHKIERRSLNLVWNNETPKRMQIDGSVTRQIVLNLLLNACEASPKGSQIVFHATVDHDRLVIIVQDQGTGIPEPVAAQMRGETRNFLAEGHHGLGAWTVGTLLKRLDGEIEIETDADKGSKITVILPLHVKSEDIHAAD